MEGSVRDLHLELCCNKSLLLDVVASTNRAYAGIAVTLRVTPPSANLPSVLLAAINALGSEPTFAAIKIDDRLCAESGLSA